MCQYPVQMFTVARQQLHLRGEGYVTLNKPEQRSVFQTPVALVSGGLTVALPKLAPPLPRRDGGVAESWGTAGETGRGRGLAVTFRA